MKPGRSTSSTFRRFSTSSLLAFTRSLSAFRFAISVAWESLEVTPADEDEALFILENNKQTNLYVIIIEINSRINYVDFLFYSVVYICHAMCLSSAGSKTSISG